MQMGWIHFLLLTTSLLIAASADAESTTILSVNAQGEAANGGSDRPAISSDGRFVAYQSSASDLVSGDTNNQNDIFLQELRTNTVTRISLGVNGTQSNSGSTSPAISQDGRHVAFESMATNLVANDTSGSQDIFVHDRMTATTVRVSVGANGVAANSHCLHPAISGDGRFVVYVSAANNLTGDDTNTVTDVFLHDRDPDQNSVFDENNGTTTRISPSGAAAAGSNSNFPSISRNGQYVAYSSFDATLVSSDSNSRQDIFVYTMQSGVTERVSIANGGQQGDGESTFTSLSDDGRYVAFISAATNLVSGDTNSSTDVFVRDRTVGTTVRASVSNSGAQSGSSSTNPVISGDGRYVSFAIESAALTAKLIGEEVAPVVLFDAVTAATGGGGGGGTSIPLVIYRRDLNQQKTVRVSSNNSGASANGTSTSLAISADGMVAAFASSAANLGCATDSNAASDVFVRDMNITTSALCGTPSGSNRAKSGGSGALLIWMIVVLLILHVFFRYLSLRFTRP